MASPMFHDSYDGPRWSYGLRFRPVSTGSVPAGWIIGSVREHPDFRHGVVDYPRELSHEELVGYELQAL